MSVRFDASSGRKISGSRLRVDVPVVSAAKSSAASPTPIALLRPSSATAIPTKRDLRRDQHVVRVDPVLPAEDVDRAREAGEPARDRHREEVVPRHRDPAVVRRLGVEADRAHLVAERRPVEDEPVDDERGERDEEADVQRLERRVTPEDAAASPRRGRRSRPGRTAACRSGAARRARTGTTPIQIAIQLSMIVEITSWAPTVAFRIPAMPAQQGTRERAGDDREQDVDEARQAGQLRADPDAP